MSNTDLDFHALLKESLHDLEMHAAGHDSGVEVHTYILGEVPKIDHVIIKRTRQELHATQKEFAHALGVSTRTVESWEIGRSHPNGSAARLMQLITTVPSMRALYQQAINDGKKTERETTLA